MRLLREGMAAQAVVEHLTKPDAGAEQRQFHIHDAKGRIAVHTGTGCIDWCGHIVREGLSVAGNMLAGPDVVTATAHAFQTSAQRSFTGRLLAAMFAGEAAGGDKRGKQSAALLIHDSESYPLYDLRVDDHADPLGELARLEEVSRERWVHFRRYMPSRARRSGLTDRSSIEELIARSIAEGYE